MHTKFMKRTLFCIFGITAVLIAGVTQADNKPGNWWIETKLEPRDLNGDNVTDAFYDPDLNITWLRDAGAHSVTQLMKWETAISWVENFSFGGYTNWRLPAGDSCVGTYCTGSEMGHLYYVELDKTPGMRGPGPFENVAKGYSYFSGTQNEFGAVLHFSWRNGDQFFLPNNLGFAMAVHPGDIGVFNDPNFPPPIPEPQTYAMMLSGLLAIFGFGRLKQRKRDLPSNFAGCQATEP